jgi:hypothetical protein
MPQAPANRAAVVSRPPSSARRTAPSGPRRPGFRAASPRNGSPASAARSAGPKPEHEILFQQYFKSVNPAKTYAAQLKRAGNGNHYLVLTEGKRDESTGEVRKTRVFIYSEDFKEYFKMLQAAAVFIRNNPVPDEVKRKRNRFWAKQAAEPPAPKSDPDATPMARA